MKKYKMILLFLLVENTNDDQISIEIYKPKYDLLCFSKF
jgi:hypothetical protein